MVKTDKKYFKDFIEGATIQINVIRALYYRELLTRVNRSQFGILGLYFDPFANILVLVALFGIRRGFKPILEVDLVMFIGTGIFMYTVFRSISIRSINSLEANQALFTYKRVKPIDTIISRTIVETLSLGIVFGFIVIGNSIIRESWFLIDLPIVLFSFLCISTISFGLGLILMIAGFRYPILQTTFPIIIRPLYFISGVFFSLQNLPQWLKPLLSWNPILQATELSRKGFSDKYFLDPLISANYLFWCVLVVLTLSLYIYQKNEKLLVSS